MTLEEFLSDYVPNVLRPMGGWLLWKSGDMRAGIRRTTATPGFNCCPMTAPYGKAPREWRECADGLGLAEEDAEVIAASADGETLSDEDDENVLADPDPAVRARLLAGLGLQEG
jgi:hypothetical protein